jgi:hypothetical protein
LGAISIKINDIDGNVWSQFVPILLCFQLIKTSRREFIRHGSFSRASLSEICPFWLLHHQRPICTW